MIKEYIGGRRCAILGLGVSNLPLAKYLCDANIPLTVYDNKDISELGEDAQKLAERGVLFCTSDKEFSSITGELIFRSPGIRPDRDGLLRAGENGLEIISEVELFLMLSPALSFGITGSDGKTTSTTLTGKFLDAACKKAGVGNTYVGGNIGTPLLTLCESMTQDDYSVLELSSFQLMSFCECGVKNAAITNISPNHLDWHRGMDEYISAKCNIIGEATRRLVTNAECPETVKIAKRYAKQNGLEIILFSSKKKSYDEFDSIQGMTAIYEKGGYIVSDDGKEITRLLSVSDIKLPGRHNLENFMTALGLTLGYVTPELCSEAARSFFGVEHRLELVRVLDGVSFYNSSIDSSPSRTAAALGALAGKQIVLICGGYDKNIPYAPLGKAICRHGGIHTVILTGATGEKIGRAIKEYQSEHALEKDIRILREPCFTSAVSLARACAQDGDTVLLSPASASFDSFKSFAERGNAFKKLVEEM